MVWTIEDERIGSDGELYMVLPCRAHATRSTWAAAAVSCPICPGQQPQPGGEAPRAETLDLRRAYEETRRQVTLEIFAALEVPVPLEVTTPRYLVGLLVSTHPIDEVLVLLSDSDFRRGHDPSVLVDAALRAMALPEVDAEEGVHFS
jgi:hypothetical protein